ncbi:MAG: DNA repair protein RadC [Lachnospiraceae bacterium]|nr:DNA repair protein RadC [Lachnospiraceae bacterium]
MKSDITTQAMPYERFMNSGPGALTDAELLAIILRTGTRDKSAVQLAEDILNSCGLQDNLTVLYQLTLEDLLRIHGIGEVKAVKLLALAELSRRMSQQRIYTDMSFMDSAKVAAYYMERLRHLRTEQAMAVFLDGRGHYLGEETLSSGTVNASLISPREIFISALRHNACGVILLHNHPSGDPTPSLQDQNITARIAESGNLLNIPLIDHIIIGDHTYTSFRELEQT